MQTPLVAQTIALAWKRSDLVSIRVVVTDRHAVRQDQGRSYQISMSSSHGLNGNEYQAAVEEEMLMFPTGIDFLILSLRPTIASSKIQCHERAWKQNDG